MPLPKTPERFAAIRRQVMARRAKALLAEIAAIDWDKLPHFNDVDEFFNSWTRLWNSPRHHDHGSVVEGKRQSVMHLLVILILLCVVFPAFARLLGGCLSVVLWFVFAAVVIAAFEALTH